MTKQKAANPILKAKDTNFLSEISSFFKKNDASKAMNSMMDMISSLNMSEHTLFGRSTVPPGIPGLTGAGFCIKFFSPGSVLYSISRHWLFWVKQARQWPMGGSMRLAIP